jgi:hypothetical protein
MAGERNPQRHRTAQFIEAAMMRSGRYLFTALLLLAFLVMPAQTAQGGQGIFEVRIKDHRDAIGDFSKLVITIDKISISPKPGLKFWQTGWKDFTASPEAIDLTQYIGKEAVRVLRASIDANSFDAFHLKIKAIEGLLKKNQRAARVKNNLGPVKLSFQVPVQGKTLLVLDLTVMDLSDHPPRGYELDIKGYELYTNGKLVDKIPPA